MWKTYFPVIDWLPSYGKADLKGDLSAGLTVGVMLIPQGMAYAMIAGLPPIHGLYASTVPLIIYGLMGTSRQLAVGPVAMISLLTAAGIGMLAEADTGTYIMLAAVLALMVGALQWLMGMLRLGFVINFLSHPVVSGFTSAAAIIIALSQLRHILGITATSSYKVFRILEDVFRNAVDINPVAVLVAIFGIVIIKFSGRLRKGLPGPLVAVVLGIPAGWFLVREGFSLSVVGEVPSGIPALIVPDLNVNIIYKLFPVALVITMVGFMESMAVANAIQARHKSYRIDPNQELRALGMANAGTSLFQGFPVTGGFSRTAVNDQSGAKTGAASVFSAIFMILTLLLLTSWFYYLPNAILAAVIVVAVAGLVNVSLPMRLWNTDRNDFYMLMATFLATLLIGIEEGILVGVILSILVVVYRTTRPHYAVLGRVPGTSIYRNVSRFDGLEIPKNILIIRFDADLYYANIQYFKQMLDREVHNRMGEIRAIVINAESISSLDSTAIHALEDIYGEYRAKGIRLVFSNVKGPVRDVMARSEWISKMGDDCFHLSTHEAVTALDCPTDQLPVARFKPFTLQTDFKPVK